MSNCDEVKNKNSIINERFKKIIEIMKKNKAKTFDENGEINIDIKEILKLELEKCVKLYCFEYGFELPNQEISVHVARTKDGQINKSPELNARGDTDGVKVYSGLQKGLESILTSPKVGLSGQILDDGKIHATQVFGKDIVSTKLSGTSYVSSNRDQLDYFAELLITGKIDLDFILDVFPHEAMHVFIPGQGVFVEGTTERLAREASDKYGLRLSPTSHSKETAIMSRLEAIVGRDAISSVALTNDQKGEREVNKQEIDKLRFENLKIAIDEKMGEGTFDKLKNVLDKEYEEFLSYRTKPDEFQIYRNNTFSETIGFLDEWIKNNPDKLQILSDSKDLSDEQKMEILKIQDKESELLQTLLDKSQQKVIVEGEEVQKISIEDAVRNAITQGIATEDIKRVESLERTNDKNVSEVSKDD